MDGSARDWPKAGQALEAGSQRRVATGVDGGGLESYWLTILSWGEGEGEYGNLS